MRSRNVFEGLSAAAVAGAVLLSASTSRADDKQVCSAAYDATQAMRREGKLQSARAQTIVCMRDACADFIRADCAKWLGEIDASQPTVVFEVKDGSGRDTSAVRVTLDGKPWLTSLDGTAKPIDPGQHTLHYEIDGAAPVDAVVQIREGEKNRPIDVTFQKAGAPVADKGTGGEPKPSSSSSPAADAPKRSIAPWIAGGVGVAGLAVGAITGAIVLGKRSDFDKHCGGSPLQCDPQGKSDASTGNTLGPVSTVGFIVGGLGIGVATVLLVTRKPSHPASPTVGLTGSMTASGPRWRLEGTW
jgi:hypothetical protein